MKKFGAFLFAASVLAAPMAAQAVDVTANGTAIFRASYVDNVYLTEDNYAGFYMGQNFSPFFRFTANENLSATMLLQTYSSGAGYGVGAHGSLSDIANGGNSLVVTFAYADYKTDDAKLKARVGVQTSIAPSYTFGIEQTSNIPQAGVKASYQVNPDIGVELFWFRPDLNGTVADTVAIENSQIDAFQLHAPMNFGSISLIPTVQVVNIGKAASNSAHTGTAALRNAFGAANLSADASINGAADGGALGWWAGVTSKMAVNENLTVAADFMYGSVDWDKSTSQDRAGFLAGFNASYRMDFGTINALAWYASGEDAADAGSERMPSYGMSGTGFKPASKLGGPWAYDAYFDGDSACSLPGGGTGTPTGTMAVGFGVSNMSFVDKLNHSFWGMYVNGTNDSAGIGRKSYLTTDDALIQVGATNWYNVNRNLVLRGEVVYLVNMIDNKASDENAMRVSTSFIYLF